MPITATVLTKSPGLKADLQAMVRNHPVKRARQLAAESAAAESAAPTPAPPTPAAPTVMVGGRRVYGTSHWAGYNPNGATPTAPAAPTLDSVVGCIALAGKLRAEAATADAGKRAALLLQAGTIESLSRLHADLSSTRAKLSVTLNTVERERLQHGAAALEQKQKDMLAAIARAEQRATARDFWSDAAILEQDRKALAELEARISSNEGGRDKAGQAVRAEWIRAASELRGAVKARERAGHLVGLRNKYESLKASGDTKGAAAFLKANQAELLESQRLVDAERN